ncbi:MAG: gamma carbonic anhydrase family protein [Thermoplasmata archaeon]|nr:gamma carbonic anhydrase family protein [Thermoplasmata archaeon]
MTREKIYGKDGRSEDGAGSPEDGDGTAGKKELGPQIDPSCFIARGAVIVGDVTLARGVSVWFNAVIRGDENRVEVGEDSNIQDNCVVHVSEDHGVYIGRNVSVGHGAIVHGARVEDDVIVGMNATVLNGARVGKGSIIGAGAVVTPGTVIPPGSLAVGVPAKVVKEGDEGVAEAARRNGEVYQEIRDRHLRGVYPPVSGGDV